MAAPLLLGSLHQPPIDMTTPVAATAPSSYSPPASNGSPITVARWPTEIPLLVVCILISIPLWIVIAVSVIGLVYAVLLTVFFAIVRLAFIAHLRGSSIKLGPDQLPELHARVAQLAQRIGLPEVPNAYLMQAGGTLNAFATRFFGTNFVVLYSELLDACGDDEPARDMIIAHELGHVHAGHLRLSWLILPSSIVPFLGTALSRAREYTCDRYGLAGAGSARAERCADSPSSPRGQDRHRA